MLKSVKGKVIAGALAVGLVFSGGFAFASTDIGANLQNWYNAKFTQVAAPMQGEMQDYVDGKQPEVINRGVGMANSATADINDSRDNALASSSEEIRAAAQSYIDDLNAKSSEISGGIEGQFDNISNMALGMLNDLAAENQAMAENLLKGHTTSAGNSAVNLVNEELNVVKSEAEADLEEAIANAKADLLAQLTAEKEQTVEELKVAVDNKIEEVFAYLEGRLDTFVAEQQALIVAKADEVENAAKSSLDDIANSNFNN